MIDSSGLMIRAQSAIEYLTTYGWAIIIIAIVLVALYNLGVFSPGSFVNTTCIFPAEFGCLNAVLYSSTDNINITLQQSTSSSIAVTAYGCNNLGTPTNMVTLATSVQLAIGGSMTFNVLCYNNGTALSINPGGVFKGYVLVKKRQIMGYSGDTGWLGGLGPHLHFMVGVYPRGQESYRTLEIRWEAEP